MRYRMARRSLSWDAIVCAIFLSWSTSSTRASGAAHRLSAAQIAYQFQAESADPTDLLHRTRWGAENGAGADRKASRRHIGRRRWVRENAARNPGRRG